MTFLEKSNLGMVVLLILIYGYYFVGILGETTHTAVEDIDYQVPLMSVIGIFIVITIIVNIGIAIFNVKDAENTDERDQIIEQKATHFSSSLIYMTAFTGLVLSMFGSSHFLISHALFGGMVLTELCRGLVKVYYYRRGF